MKNSFGLVASLLITWLNPLLAFAEAPVQSPNSGELPHTGLPSNPISELTPLVIGQGEQRLLTVTGLVRYSLGNERVRAAKLPASDLGQTSESLLLKGIEPGLTDLWVWKQDKKVEHRTIQVEQWSPEKKDPYLQRALSRLEEVEIILSGGVGTGPQSVNGLGVVLRGKIRSLDESARVAALTRGFPDQVRDETELSVELVTSGEKQIEEWIRKARYSDQIRVERFEDVLWVRGHIANANQRVSVEKKLKALFPQIQLELESLPDAAPTIHFRVFLLELKKSRFSSFGIGWPGSQAGAFHVSAWGIKEALQLDLAIQALEGEGSARVLSNPELVVRAPGEAELFAGGEVPIKTQTHVSSNVTWRTFGLSLKLKVTHVAGNQVRLDIATEVSHLDPTLSAEMIPGLQANRMKTQVDARFGVPLLLSGLLQEGMKKQARGLPFLRDLPVLGALFGSEDYQSDRSELVAILLPQAEPPPAPMGRFAKFLPRGAVPAPRNWISPDKEQGLRAASDYPWNVLQ
ncbi:MAG: type II and III secretion system protein [Methylotenera sp.]|nr:type II and III secretion system protein [Oligoflexia bacterium]